MDAPQDPLAQYAFRRSVLEQQRTYSLYPDRLVVEGPDIAVQTYPLERVQRVRLKYEHTKQRAYYQCFIYTGGGRIALRHVSWHSFGEFADRRATYTPFVQALLAQLSQYPHVQFQGGSMVNFVSAIAGVPLMGGLGLLAHHFGRTGSATLAAAMMTICLLMIGPSRPRRFDPLAPPEDLLP